MCGDHEYITLIDEKTKGSPPHVRGPLQYPMQPFQVTGITPACAGTTLFPIEPIIILLDHPRMCGDHIFDSVSEAGREGSPPHVRGPQNTLMASILGDGITPACAGTTQNWGRGH